MGDLSASALEVRVSFGAGNSVRETYEYMLNHPLPFMKDSIVKQLAKYIRRSHYMFRLHHGPHLLGHDLFVSESTDQIEALAHMLITGGKTDLTAWTEQSPPIGNISAMPELPPPLPVNEECTGASPQQSTSCQTVTSKSTTTLKDHAAHCNEKCNFCVKGRVHWYCVS